ncbi:hypothetical protein J6590_078779 [Homalodisca vitripennis]|nr:hypothetical protein J6590_078779 [Homalodisca vitripennis]
MAQCSGYNGYRKITRSSNVTDERSCPCKLPACPAIGGGSEVTFKPLVPSIKNIDGHIRLTFCKAADKTIIGQRFKGSPRRNYRQPSVSWCAWETDSHVINCITTVVS